MQKHTYPPSVIGEAWKERVYKLVQEIPVGRVATYGQLAKLLRLPTPRMIGWALHRNPDESNIPCHRVVFADGSLAPNFAFGGSEEQRYRLKAEGVSFVSDKKVKLSECKWSVVSN